MNKFPLASKINQSLRHLVPLIVLVALLVPLVGPSQVVSAFTCASGISQDDCDSLYGNWPQYKAETLNVVGCSEDISASAGKLPGDVLSRIEKLQPAYQQASSATGVPWKLLAAIHFREANNDPNHDLQAGNPIGGPYAAYSTDYSKYGYPKSVEQSAEMAAKHLISVENAGVVHGKINTDNPDPQLVKDVLFSYNGRASFYAEQAKELGFNPKTEPFEGSPYVMNNYDDVHHNMKIASGDFGGIDAIDTRMGAFTVYALLGGATSGGGSSECGGSAVAGDAVKTALNYAWPKTYPSPHFDMKPSYQAAIKKAIANGEYVGGGDHPGIDCGGFVTRVMRDSGADPNYNSGQGDTGVQLAYLKNHPNKYKYVGTDVSTAKLQPGDIAMSDIHTFIYVGDQDGFPGNIAEASYGGVYNVWFAPQAGVYAPGKSSHPFAFYRPIKAN